MKTQVSVLSLRRLPLVGAFVGGIAAACAVGSPARAQSPRANAPVTTTTQTAKLIDQLRAARSAGDEASYQRILERAKSRPQETAKDLAALLPRTTDEQTRQHAITMIASLSPKHQIELRSQLLKVVSSAKAETRVMAMRVLTNLDPFWAEDAIDVLREFLKSDDQLTREEAIRTAGLAGGACDPLVDDLSRIVDNKAAGSNARMLALDSLSRIAPNDARVAQVVESGLDDSALRGLSITAVAAIEAPTPRMVTSLLGIARSTSGNRSEQESALRVLGKLHKVAPNTREVVTRALSANDANVREAAAAAIARIGRGDPTTAELLFKQLSKEEIVSVREELIAAIGTCGIRTKSVLERLMPFTHDQDARLRYRSAEVIGVIGGFSEDTKRQLQTLLCDDNVAVRVAAALAMARNGHMDSAVTRIIKDVVARDERFAMVPIPTAEILQIIPEFMIGRLVRDLVDDDPHVRADALASFALVRFRSRAVSSLLVNIAKNDQVTFVRYNAVVALKPSIEDGYVRSCLELIATTDASKLVRKTAGAAVEKFKR